MLLFSVTSPLSSWVSIFSAHLIDHYTTVQPSTTSYYLILLDCFLGTAASLMLFSLMGELLKSSKLSVSFLDSLMGESGVLTVSLEVPLLV